MNRSFPSIAALLVSLSGAMLAVTWIPGETPRPSAQGVTGRKRAAAVSCGYLTSGKQMATAHPRHSAGEAAVEAAIRCPSARWNSTSPDMQAMLDRSRLRLSSIPFLPLPALKSVGSALKSGLAPLWPLGGQRPIAGDEQKLDDERRRSEAEYAAAELAAAAPQTGALVAPAWRRGQAWLGSGIESAAAGKPWIAMYQGINEQIIGNYRQVIGKHGWQQTIPPLVAHIRRLHGRVALREALLKEMDRRFLEMPLDHEFPLPPKPRFRGPSRKLMLAAADALKALSQSLSGAADRLEEASRQDVAELHIPSENREGKR
jgi:hypothetical protein